ncbi:hypothetical protein [Jeotgalicoccus sp. WY2]|uniref:hypothetical protein n=1 Tax=Jeotgalicoccus sp. WY2 TaxID=2708346 RepID=UPI001BD37333|nr:hypothetical protein [Jeotgalicoccus sp. WY2]
MYNALSNIKSPYPETIIHVGFWESHYLKHVVPFMEMAKELGIENVNLSIADYTTHSELAKYYPIFLQEQVNKIINDN